MIKRSASIPMVVLAVFALVIGASCKKAQDLMKYKDEAMKLVEKYKPQLDSLKPKLAGLLGKADGLKSVPGFDQVQKLLGDANNDAAAVTASVEGVPAAIEAAVKGGKLDDVKKVVADTQGIGEKITKLEASVSAAEAEVKKLEDAKAAAPTGAGSGSDAGSAAGAGSGSDAGSAANDLTWMFKLPGGFELKGDKGGIEDSLVAFVQDSAKAVDKDTWFSFDHLAFQTGKAELDMDKSKDQLSNINEILKAFPNVKLKIGGYTDNVGKADANKKLSQTRAEAVMKALVGMGVKADRLEAEGYGQEHPVCAANDTDECKAKNRRIDVRVTAK